MPDNFRDDTAEPFPLTDNGGPWSERLESSFPKSLPPWDPKPTMTIEQRKYLELIATINAIVNAPNHGERAMAIVHAQLWLKDSGELSPRDALLAAAEQQRDQAVEKLRRVLGNDEWDAARDWLTKYDQQRTMGS